MHVEPPAATDVQQRFDWLRWRTAVSNAALAIQLYIGRWVNRRTTVQANSNALVVAATIASCIRAVQLLRGLSRSHPQRLFYTHVGLSIRLGVDCAADDCRRIYQYLAGIPQVASPPAEALNIAISMSVCPLLYVNKLHVQTSWNFSCVLTVTVAQFFSDDTAIRYVLPVCEWRHVMGHLVLRVGNIDVGAVYTNFHNIRQGVLRCLISSQCTVAINCAPDEVC